MVASLVRNMGSRAWAQQLWCVGLVAPQQVRSPGPGIESVSLALQGGFLTTGPPKKPEEMTSEAGFEGG